MVCFDLPEKYTADTGVMRTPLGIVDLGRDHLSKSVREISDGVLDQLGWSPSRVALVTTARFGGSIFSAIGVYLLFKKRLDLCPSAYLLEAGLGTGEPMMLYLGKTIDTIIVAQSGYAATPFASEKNTYTGQLVCDPTTGYPVRLVVEAREPGQRQNYIKVVADYKPVRHTGPVIGAQRTLEAASRITGIAARMAMQVPNSRMSLLRAVRQLPKLMPVVEKLRPACPFRSLKS